MSLCTNASPFNTANARLVNDKSDEARSPWITDTPLTDVKVAPIWLRDPEPVKSTLQITTPRVCVRMYDTDDKVWLCVDN